MDLLNLLHLLSGSQSSQLRIKSIQNCKFYFGTARIGNISVWGKGKKCLPHIIFPTCEPEVKMTSLHLFY